MAKRDEELDELREMVRKRQRAVGQKVSRLENKRRVRLAGSKLDPRRDTSKVKSYNRTQLKAYYAKLDTFMDRKVQFVGGKQGAPISAQAWRKYKAAENAYNQRADAEFDSVKDLKTLSGSTISDRMKRVTPDYPTFENSANNSPYKKIDRGPSGQVNEDKLAQLTKDLQSKARPDYFKKTAQRDKQAVIDMLAVTGSEQFRTMFDVMNLTDKQFNVLFNLSGFVESISLWYEIHKDLMGGKDERWFASTIDDRYTEAKELVKWARTIK